MTKQTIGIIVHGATGRIGSTQHLANALLPIINEGGLPLGNDRLLPRLLLVGRDAERLAPVARAHNVADWSTDLNAALASRDHAIFFDAAATGQRGATLERAIAAGKHVYCEKPLASTAAGALALMQKARERGLKHGVVEDKVHLPGMQKLAALTRSGALGRIVGFRLEFGGGCSTAATGRASGQAGIIAPRAAVSFSTCTRTGATSSRASSDASCAWRRRNGPPSPSASMKTGRAMMLRSRTLPPRWSRSKAAHSVPS
jgi:predicted dehydrogenase